MSKVFKGPDPKPVKGGKKKPAKKEVKQPVKHASLPLRGSYIDPGLKGKGLVAFIDPQEMAYREVMGRPSPEPFPEGTVAFEQFTYRKDSRGRSAEDLAHPRAKPKKKVVRHRKGRKPIGA